MKKAFFTVTLVLAVISFISCASSDSKSAPDALADSDKLISDGETIYLDKDSSDKDVSQGDLDIIVNDDADIASSENDDATHDDEIIDDFDKIDSDEERVDEEIIPDEFIAPDGDNSAPNPDCPIPELPLDTKTLYCEPGTVSLSGVVEGKSFCELFPREFWEVNQADLPYYLESTFGTDGIISVDWNSDIGHDSEGLVDSAVLGLPKESSLSYDQISGGDTSLLRMPPFENALSYRLVLKGLKDGSESVLSGEIGICIHRKD